MLTEVKDRTRYPRSISYRLLYAIHCECSKRTQVLCRYHRHWNAEPSFQTDVCVFKKTLPFRIFPLSYWQLKSLTLNLNICSILFVDLIKLKLDMFAQVLHLKEVFECEYIEKLRSKAGYTFKVFSTYCYYVKENWELCTERHEDFLTILWLRWILCSSSADDLIIPCLELWNNSFCFIPVGYFQVPWGWGS